MPTNNAIVYVTQAGLTAYLQTLNGVISTTGQIGLMADRILWTQSQIGEMANRIVYVTEFSQNNILIGVYLIASLNFLGVESGLYKYRIFGQSVPSLPF